MGLEKGQLLVKLKKDEVLCLQGDPESDLYIIHSGKLMICVNKGSAVTPVAYLGPGEYLGELSFFDGSPRSANVICVEDCELIKIPRQELAKQFPKWLIKVAQNVTKQLRLVDEIIMSKGIKRKNVQSIKPLEIGEQGRYFKIMKTVKDSRKS